jgi:hypothetical protein
VAGDVGKRFLGYTEEGLLNHQRQAALVRMHGGSLPVCIRRMHGRSLPACIRRMYCIRLHLHIGRDARMLRPAFQVAVQRLGETLAFQRAGAQLGNDQPQLLLRGLDQLLGFLQALAGGRRVLIEQVFGGAHLHQGGKGLLFDGVMQLTRQAVALL